MNIQKIKKKIRQQVTVERIIMPISAVFAYTYVMNKRGYQMVKPLYRTEDGLFFREAFRGTSLIRLNK